MVSQRGSRYFFSAVLTLASSLLLAATASAGLIVHDTWQDANRNEPTTAAVTDPYSENGTDSDGDGDLESVWYGNPGSAMVATTGHLTTTQQTGSSSDTTYFTPESAPVTLAKGESIKVKWVFTPTGLGVDTGRGLRTALVDTAGANRLIADGTPASSTFTGYRVSLNVSSADLTTNSIELRRRMVLTSDNLLVNDNRWTGALAMGGEAAADGMVNGTQYTYLLTLKRTQSDDMEINASVSGGTLNDTGVLSLSFTDTAANVATGGGYTFDTFGMRPSSAAVTATTFDTTLFQVEYCPVPEPASLALVGLGGLMLAGLAHRRR